MRDALKNMFKRSCLVARDLIAPFRRFEEVSILCYHSISDDKDATAVSQRAFDRHLELLKKCGCVFVSLADIEAWRQGARVLPRRSVAVTFDDGYTDFETTALPILKKYRAPATVFVLGDPRPEWMSGKPPLLDSGALERLRAEPMVEVGYHSLTHPDFRGLTEEAAAREAAPLSRERRFAYPGGDHPPQAVRAVMEAGYANAYAIRPALVRRTSNPYLLPRSVVLAGARSWELRFATTRAADWYQALRAIWI